VQQLAQLFSLYCFSGSIDMINHDIGQGVNTSISSHLRLPDRQSERVRVIRSVLLRVLLLSSIETSIEANSCSLTADEPFLTANESVDQIPPLLMR
jgi:hypothetical protein